MQGRDLAGGPRRETCSCTSSGTVSPATKQYQALHGLGDFSHINGIGNKACSQFGTSKAR